MLDGGEAVENVLIKYTNDRIQLDLDAILLDEGLP